MSRRSFSFIFGRMSVVKPALRAASTFSLMPPTGSTTPRSVISPVMARSSLTTLSVSSEMMEVTMVTPADGPSLGMAPAGTWMWSPWSFSMERPMDLTMLRASLADSFMTSPIWPVRIISSLPSTCADSTNRISPPNGVQASPVATPGMRVRCLDSGMKRTGPSAFSTNPVSMANASLHPEATWAAMVRRTDAISRWRFRTPDSLV